MSWKECDLKGGWSLVTDHYFLRSGLPVIRDGGDLMRCLPLEAYESRWILNCSLSPLLPKSPSVDAVVLTQLCCNMGIFSCWRSLWRKGTFIPLSWKKLQWVSSDLLQKYCKSALIHGSSPGRGFWYSACWSLNSPTLPMPNQPTSTSVETLFYLRHSTLPPVLDMFSHQQAWALQYHKALCDALVKACTSEIHVLPVQVLNRIWALETANQIRKSRHSHCLANRFMSHHRQFAPTI